MPDLLNTNPRIVVIGVGGAGGNAVNNMIAAGLSGIEFVSANTDTQALEACKTDRRIQLGRKVTDGLGAGSKPEIGEKAAEEALEEIHAHICGAHMVFITAGMGGGTGTGAAYVIARVAKELGILTIAVVTKPFQFEGAQRMRNAEAGIAALKHYVDTLLVIPNENLFRVATNRTTFAEAFEVADQVLYSGIACLVDVIVQEGLINLDLADVRTVMSGMGEAMLGIGEANGERRAVAAAEEAIVNPLLDNVSLKGAKNMLLSITGSPDLTLWEVDSAVNRLREEVEPDANIIVGAILDDSLGDRMRISIVASGMAKAKSLETCEQSDVQGWRPRCEPGATTLSGPEHYGWRLGEAIAQSDVQDKSRTARRTGAKAAASARAGRPKTNGGSKKRAATQLPQRKSAPPTTATIADDALAQPSLPGGGGPVGWPSHWASASEDKVAPALPEYPPRSSPTQDSSAVRHGTLLQRLADLISGRRM
jgi:cell division protein FtsZ